MLVTLAVFASTALVPPVAPDVGGVVILGASDLSHTYDGQRYLFQRISFGLARGSKTALVGVNDAGKSSLLRVLGGLEQPESGTVDTSGKVRLAFVDQEPSLPAGQDASEFLFSSSAPAVSALREYRAAAAAAEAADGTDSVAASSERLGRAATQMDATDGWAIEAEMVRLCESLDVEHLLSRDAASLSGGERKRVALAAALLQSPELLLLDEPTNHLDIDAIRWLEGELADRDISAIIVTHDRAFLSATCSEVLELDRAAVYRHKGSYEDFLTSKAARMEVEGQQNAAASNKLRAELKWVQRQPKARSTKSKSRLEAYEQLSQKVNAGNNRAASGSKTLKLEAGTQRLGGTIVSFEGASVDALSGAAVLRDFTYDFKRGDRLGIVGPNGAGKSTLLRALQAQLPLNSGRVEIGDTVSFGHYEQQGLDWPDEMRVLDLVREAVARGPDGGKSGEVDERAASTLLSQFLFPPARWGERIGKLSGGERRRLQLLTVLAKKPNFLMLDEPTNDLDLSSIQVLEEFLVSYGGVLVVVSHDRYFLDKVVDHHFVLAGDGTGELVDWQGSFSEYLDYRDAKAAVEAAAAAPSAPPAAAPADQVGATSGKVAATGGDDDAAAAASKAAKPLSNFEVREMARLEAELEALNEEQAELQRKVSNFDANRNGYTELQEWTEATDALTPRIEQVEEKWLALAERA